MLDGFIGVIAIVALIYFVVRLYSRVGALEGEVVKLRTALAMPQSAEQQAAAEMPKQVLEAEAPVADIPEVVEDPTPAEEPNGPWARARAARAAQQETAQVDARVIHKVAIFERDRRLINPRRHGVVFDIAPIAAEWTRVNALI